LTEDPDIDASEISVSVRNGEVTLEGSVAGRRMKRAAEDCAEDIAGVKQVHNASR
jgi:osmotically-inducible protein OsmY